MSKKIIDINFQQKAINIDNSKNLRTSWNALMAINILMVTTWILAYYHAIPTSDIYACPNTTGLMNIATVISWTIALSLRIFVNRLF